jgi:hypothetical protein
VGQPHGSRSQHRRAAREQGAAATEFALVVLPLITLLFAIIEGGFLMRTHLSVGSATENGVREASVAGKSPTADFAILQAIRGDLTVSEDEITRVIVFKPSSIGADPAASCLAGASVPGTCNVYTGADLRRPKADFGCLSALDASWCPTTRSDRVDSPDLIGVYVEINHELLTKFFGDGVALSRVAILPIERGKDG